MQRDVPGILAVGLWLSILLGLVIATLPRGCSKHLTVETHDKSDAKYPLSPGLIRIHAVDKSDASLSPTWTRCNLLPCAFISSVKDRALKFRYRAAQRHP